MPTSIPHRDQYINYFAGAIEHNVLHKVPQKTKSDKVPVAATDSPPLVVVNACGHASHNANRYPHLWERITPLTQLYCNNGGGVVFDPAYAAMNEDHELFHRPAVGQIYGFIDLAIEDGTLNPDAELPVYLVYDVPCKVFSALNWTPQEFVESSIRAKTYLKGMRRRGVTFKVGLLYFLGEPIYSSGQTWYAARCDMQRYNEEYLQQTSVDTQ